MTSLHELEREVAAERHALADTLQELGGRLRAAGDWRSHMDERPLTTLTAVAIIGLVAGAASHGVSPEVRRAMRRGVRRVRQRNGLGVLLDGVVAAVAERAATFTEDALRQATRSFLPRTTNTSR